MEVDLGTYQADNHANSYGKGLELATTFFNLFNGKINPLFPARCLMFGHLPDGAWGSTIGDIVQLDMHKIMQDVSRFGEPTKGKILLLKGIILYSIVHELFHLEQDIAYYSDLTSNSDEMTKLIEDSCHCATTNFCVGLEKYNLLPMDLVSRFEYYRPVLETFTTPSQIHTTKPFGLRMAIPWATLACISNPTPSTTNSLGITTA